MQRFDDIAYAPANGFRGLADLFLPDQPGAAPSALVIHGGGWNAMDRTSLTPVAMLMAECGYAALNINYRLLDDAPWPACGKDCVAGGQFLLDANHEALRQLDVSRIVVIGASAGGHLALWAGLSLPADRVKGIISIAGPADLPRRWRKSTSSETWKKFLGSEDVTAEKLLAASPVSLVHPHAPPLLCIHSTNDELVSIEQSEAILEAYRKVGAQARLASFSGPGKYHGIWKDGSGEVDLADRVLVSQVKTAVREFLKKL
jgi:acetyl esterase/lipase